MTQNLPSVEVRGFRVLTSQQLANEYGTTIARIKDNFSANRDKYIEGKHYISLTGEALSQFKNKVGNSDLVGKRARVLYLWTEKGALLHAKSLNTDKAWEVYDYLVDFYFRAKEEVLLPESNSKAPELPATAPALPSDIHIPEMTNAILILHVLLDLAGEFGLSVASFDFMALRSAIHGNRIGIKSKYTVEETAYELAFELAHAIVHKGYGDMVKSPLAKEYNQHAKRIAEFLIKALNVKMKHLL